MIGSDAQLRPWLLVEASHQGMLRVATAKPSQRPRLENIRQIDVGGVPTFTDALQRYEREAGLELRGVQCAIAMAGATSGESLSLVRSRWTISRSGLEAIFQRPAVVLNDVAARAWAIRAGTASIQTLRGMGSSDLARTGRYGMIMVEEGVGAAIIDVDRERQVRILETESGHMDFTPADQRDEKLAESARGTAPLASWERLLMLQRDDPAWRHAYPELAETERPRVQAGILGRFCVQLMHAFGAWQGIILTGSRTGAIVNPNSRASFEASFGGRRNFSRLISACPVWTVDQNEAVLTGAAERLAHDLGAELRIAA